ncbi:transaldolase [Stenotrophomonas panacihumi]|uniref:Transaldolase n=1 Tax=Stenotrophomonas panacihumi TaxID=676599 RepID=A0A0R0AVF9_9GAMM|nr:transaldolase [Stenotrophomonas panacihumi]KRG45124.1 transaldolase [Stenotrophomonas panacihumi]PTN55527.1 transaldolase [Stenotrophomonas panacihumi]
MTSQPSKLAQLRDLSVVVADTGDYDAIKRLKPVDCTTNPTLVKKALDLPVYAELIERELAWGKQQGGGEEVVNEVADRLTIGVGTMLAALVPGRVSTEVDADLAHDTAATIAKAHKFIQMYAERGVPREKILIKVAATWEGVEAARQLQKDGIDCNLTLIFNQTQALACAEAGVFLISPFVGRILDWFVANGQTPANIDEDPGVKFVRGVYTEFKKRGSSTVVMGASFRSTAQIEALAGCDRLTISPDLLEKLEADHGDLPRKLSPVDADGAAVVAIDAAKFAKDLAADPMATEKLSTGIDTFAKDLQALRETIRGKLG